MTQQMKSLANQVVLVTGANREIGREFVHELLDRGVQKIYAAVRRPETVDFESDRVIPLRLDLLDTQSIAVAATQAQEVTVLINNAGISTGASLIAGDLNDLRKEMDTHFWGTLAVIREFSPVLAKNGGGAIENVLSALSWFSTAGAGGYAAAKSAAWNMTNAIRLELAANGTLVQDVLFGVAKTDLMAENYTGPAIDAREVPRKSLDGLQNDQIEVVVDEITAWVKSALAGDRSEFYKQINGSVAWSELPATALQAH